MAATLKHILWGAIVYIGFAGQASADVSHPVTYSMRVVITHASTDSITVAENESAKLYTFHKSLLGVDAAVGDSLQVWHSTEPGFRGAWKMRPDISTDGSTLGVKPRCATTILPGDVTLVREEPGIVEFTAEGTLVPYLVSGLTPNKKYRIRTKREELEDTWFGDTVVVCQQYHVLQHGVVIDGKVYPDLLYPDWGRTTLSLTIRPRHPQRATAD